MNTPWGTSQQVETIARGIHWVSTASHGGLIVSAGLAIKLLSERAIAVAFPGLSGGYVCFEEDCSYAVAFLEHPEWKRHLDKLALAEWENSVLDADSYMGKAKAQALPRLQTAIAKTDKEISEYMAEVVRSWNPEYFQQAESNSIAEVRL